MSTDRREFLGAVVGAGLAIGGNTGRRDGRKILRSSRSPVPPTDWDVSWTARVSGSHRAVFDSPEVSEGLGLLRTLVWIKDYGDVYGAAPTDMSAVVVLRH
ncbi:MAG TPA: hypothetical protein VFU23_16440, partial [Gemmatimonadales bacterium]|nr:hypothetical protein [Gemmatimonadales bacterium]